jgi:hypothetical protein
MIGIFFSDTMSDFAQILALCRARIITIQIMHRPAIECKEGLRMVA